MSLASVILLLVVLMLVGALPAWPHSSHWGYAPSGALGTVFIIILILFFLGKI
jgi:hypothetical protein